MAFLVSPELELNIAVFSLLPKTCNFHLLSFNAGLFLIASQ